MQKKKDYSVLYIEDEKEIREDYIRYLQKYFFNVYSASDGEEGLILYKKYKPNILIVDLNLPVLSGIDVIKEIRKIDYTIKIIVLTAYMDSNYLIQLIDLKLTKYLNKPISRFEFKYALEFAINEIVSFEIISKEIIYLQDSFYWDKKETLLYQDGVIVKLTGKEKLLLKKLFTNHQHIYNYNELIYSIWNDDFFEENKLNSLKTIIKNVRKKLPKDLITNVFSIGYKLNI